MSKTTRKRAQRINCVAEVTRLALQRWHDATPMPVADVELIGADRLRTPLTGESVSDRWNNNFQWAG